MRIGFVSAAFLLSLLLASRDARATRVPHVRPQQLVNESAAIVVGTVTAVAYETSRTGEPVTTVRLQGLEVVTGKEQLDPYLDRGLTLALPGGLTKQGWQQAVVGLPSLKLGHTYLLFLQSGEWTVSPFTGWTQGVLQVVPGPDQKRYLLTYQGQLVTGITADAVATTPLQPPKAIEKAAAPEARRGELQLAEKTSEVAGQSAATALYREDNEQQLIAEDEKRAQANVAETATRIDQEWRALATTALPMERALAVLQELAAKGDQRAPRVLKLEAAPGAAEKTQQGPPMPKKN